MKTEVRFFDHDDRVIGVVCSWQEADGSVWADLHVEQNDLDHPQRTSAISLTVFGDQRAEVLAAISDVITETLNKVEEHDIPQAFSYRTLERDSEEVTS